jgi:Putative undecaprenyl diphosphate synthase
MPNTKRSQTGDLSHVLVCAGTSTEWLATTPEQWKVQIDALVRAVSGENVRYLTICPYSGENNANDKAKIRGSIIFSQGGLVTGDRVSIISSDGLLVVIDTCSDGQQRFVNAVAQLSSNQVIDEAKLAATIVAPASGEPDLTLILGPPTIIPQSLVWELAYSEIVFLDVPWLKCDVEHIQMAINDFQRRDRRFGGIDS